LRRALVALFPSLVPNSFMRKEMQRRDILFLYFSPPSSCCSPPHFFPFNSSLLPPSPRYTPEKVTLHFCLPFSSCPCLFSHEHFPLLDKTSSRPALQGSTGRFTFKQDRRVPVFFAFCSCAICVTRFLNVLHPCRTRSRRSS